MTAIHYDHGVVKKNADGVTVVAATLEEGETLLNGTTYEQELERLGLEPESSPFAQRSMDMTEHNKVDDPAYALTIDESGVNTRSSEDGPTAPAKIAEPDLSTVITTNEDDSAAKVLTDVPAESDGKQKWYDFAVKNYGFDVAYDDATKTKIVEYVGEQKNRG